MNLSEKIQDMQQNYQEALKELERAQVKVSELHNLVQRQTGALRVLMDLRDEQSAESNGVVEELEVAN